MTNKKNILLISMLWSGMKSFFFEGKNEFRGMPAFTNVFKRLINDTSLGHIHIILYGKFENSNICIPKEYSSKIFIYPCRVDGRFGITGALFLSIYYSIKVLLKDKIFLIYGHGSIGAIAGIISLITKIPNCRRLYGTFLAAELENSSFRIFINHPLEYLCFKLPAKALIITNDGTKGDLVYNKIGRKTIPFYFLLNGVDIVSLKPELFSSIKVKYDFNFEPDICYVARIDRWKRQHLLLEAIVQLSKKGININTIIAGQIIDLDYFNNLQKIIKDNSLEKNVKIIPGVSSNEANSILNNSKLSASFYDFSNLGNVFLESIIFDCVPIAENINDSLAIFEKNIYIEVNPMDTLKLSSIIETTLNNQDYLNNIAKLGKEYASKYLLNWSQRVEREFQIILK